MTVLLMFTVSLVLPGCCCCSCCSAGVSAIVVDVLSPSGSLLRSIVVNTGARLDSSGRGVFAKATTPPITTTIAIMATATPFFLLNGSQTMVHYLRDIEPNSRKHVLTPEEISQQYLLLLLLLRLHQVNIVRLALYVTCRGHLDELGVLLHFSNRLGATVRQA